MRKLVTTAVGKNWNTGDQLGYDEYTVQHMVNYAKKIEADFFMFRGSEVLFHQFCGQPTWYRLEIFKQIRSARNYTHGLYLDADVLVHPKAPDIFDEIGDADFAWALEGWCHGVPPEDHKHLIRTNFKTEVTYNSYCNAGVLLFSVNGLDKLVIEPPFPMAPLFDQCWLNYKIKTNPIIVEKMIDSKWNYIPGDLSTEVEGFYHCAFLAKALLPELSNKFNKLS